MEAINLTGKLIDITVNYITNTYNIGFTINEPDRLKKAYNELKEIELLDINVKKHREKRSLNANAYAWQLMTKLAETLGSSKDEVYEQMLRDYGSLMTDEDGQPLLVTIKSTTDPMLYGLHLKFLKTNGTHTAYLIIKGSSEYDTKEMSTFIDGIVYECKELGIETLTPDELERMKQQWKA